VDEDKRQGLNNPNKPINKAEPFALLFTAPT
jgi:hypothetical protein